MKPITYGSLAAGIAVVALAVGMTACAPTLKLVADTFDVEIVPEKVQEGAFKSASVGFTAWEGIQDAVERLGKLPRCTEAVKYLCVSQATWNKIKEIEAKASGTLESTRPLIAADSDVELLMSVPTVVYDAQAAIQKAKEQ